MEQGSNNKKAQPARAVERLPSRKRDIYPGVGGVLYCSRWAREQNSPNPEEDHETASIPIYDEHLALRRVGAGAGRGARSPRSWPGSQKTSVTTDT